MGSSKEVSLLLQADEKHKREKFVLSVAFSPDGKRLACGVMDGTVALFDVPSGKLMHTLTGHHKPVRDVCFTPGLCRSLCCCMHILLIALEAKAACLIRSTAPLFPHKTYRCWDQQVSLTARSDWCKQSAVW